MSVGGHINQVATRSWGSRTLMLPLMLFVLVFCACEQAIAQSGKGEVKLAVQPMKDLVYILDGKQRLTASGLMLEPGLHRFVFWAPDRTIVDTTIHVVADSVVVLRKVLPPSPEYRAYIAGLKSSSKQRLAYRAVPMLFTGISAGLALGANKKRTDADAALRDAEDLYSTARNPGVIANLKERDIPALQSDLDKAHRRTMLWTGAAVLGAAATVAGFIKAARIEDPVYEDRQKARFDAMAWIASDGPGFFATLNIPIR